MARLVRRVLAASTNKGFTRIRVPNYFCKSSLRDLSYPLPRVFDDRFEISCTTFSYLRITQRRCLRKELRSIRFLLLLCAGRSSQRQPVGPTFHVEGRGADKATEKAVSNFFAPASRKETAKVTWRSLDSSLLIGVYGVKKTSNGEPQIKRRRVAGFDLV